ncbi:MAG TPA: hypothetical protein VFG23_19205 [Polyangia bacterium]|nr:hypothetical protein [Polyangia bacterium]
MANTEIAVVAPLAGAELARLDEFESYLRGDGEPPEIIEDPAVIQQQILDRLLNAESDEQLEAETVGLIDLARRFVAHDGLKPQPGVVLELVDFEWRPSSFEDGPPVYVIVLATRMDNGEMVACTTGSLNIMGQLANMKRRGTLSGAVRIPTEVDKPTAGNKWPMWLRTPDDVKERQRTLANPAIPDVGVPEGNKAA